MTSLESDARYRIGKMKAQRILQPEAAEQGIPVQTYAERFWLELADEMNVQGFDSRYRSISYKDLAWQANTVSPR
ncbi:MAG TPA: hypothetical protein VM733_21235 [Thermoanaerobaculia bacterium]|nr:hypothetical protein [Thermoanaerobaculia bacterium]